jgi:hypothetical protein
VDKDTSIGISNSASTMGAAVLASYAVNDRVSLPVRAEYIDSRGKNTNLLYGAGSNAWSLTATPTYQKGVYFGRVEASYVKADQSTSGSAFGKNGDKDNQGRLMLETGIIF